MNFATIELSLRALDFDIACINRIDYGQQIRLRCGAIINVYDNGTVLAQGKLQSQCREALLNSLKHILPSDTRWYIK